MAPSPADEAVWENNQAECHKWMNHLISINNDFAKDPDCDFDAFRDAADGLVRAELDEQKAKAKMPACALGPFLFDVFRRVWLGAKLNPFQLPSSFPYDSIRPASVLTAPFLIFEDLEESAKGVGGGKIGVKALHNYVYDNLDAKYNLDEFLDEGVAATVPPLQAQLELSHEDVIRHQANFKESIRQKRDASSQSLPDTEPRAKRQKTTSDDNLHRVESQSLIKHEESANSSAESASSNSLSLGAAALDELEAYGTCIYCEDYLRDRMRCILGQLLKTDPIAVSKIKAFMDMVMRDQQTHQFINYCIRCIVKGTKEGLASGLPSQRLQMQHMRYRPQADWARLSEHKTSHVNLSKPLARRKRARSWNCLPFFAQRCPEAEPDTRLESQSRKGGVSHAEKVLSVARGTFPEASKKTEAWATSSLIAELRV
ncbi:hypothetical protein QBC39DRAFT_326314 [Podospora conica]|nr:hypothetical protein QBC39DRAFT_326314 [Schizothecium conicum]